MKFCPVCNDTFADQLNFCDVDGARLTKGGGAPERNKWWSLVGAALLIGALVIIAASIFFLPRSRVQTPIVSSEPPPAPVTPKPQATETTASSAAPVATGEPETASAPADVPVPEVKKKDRALSNSNSSIAVPNPKAAALAAEEGEKKPATVDAAAPPVNKKPEQPAIKTVSEPHPADTSVKAQTPPDPKAQVASKTEKDSKDKKKEDEKKKGGFLKVFKKIFGKD
jgi:hypothetical protein